MYKIFVFAAVVAAAQAGLAPVAYSYGYSPIASTAVGASSQSTLRSLDGSQVVSQYSKAVDTAFSSVRKHDTRITNDAQYLAPVAHAAPLAYAAHPAPLAYAAHPAPLAYAAPVAHAAVPVAHAAVPVAHAAAPVVRTGLLGVAYSAAPAVSHIDFSGYGVHYGW